MKKTTRQETTDLTQSSRFELANVAAQLRIPKAGQALCTDWEAAMRIPPVKAAPFLDSTYITQAGQAVFLTEDMIKTLVAFATRIAGDEDVIAFFWYCRHRMLNDPTLVHGWEEQWPPLNEILGQDAGLLNVLVMLSIVPEMQETYRRLSIPPEVARDTLEDLRRWMETDFYYQHYQRWGITPWIARWLCHHWQGKLFHLKRLQFSPDKFAGRLRAYRRKGGRELIAISEPGIRYRADGNAWGACCGDDPGDWTSILEVTGDAIAGNPILPTGLVRQRMQRLSLHEWDQVLVPGDEILSIHIPTGGPMTFDDCGESFRQALEFFPRYFPELNFRGFATGTWFLDPRLENLLSPESNIVRLMREVFLYPGIQADNREYYQRVFGWGVTDISKVPRRTALQKAISQYLNGGGHFHGGYCFLLKEDFRWGSQVYRSAL